MSLASGSAHEIELLKTSAAFSMSLGAKEIFHTNFLAFLLESDEPSLLPMQLAVRTALGFPQSEGALPRCAVWREKNNRDLVVVELRGEGDAAVRPHVADQINAAQDVPRPGSWDWNPRQKWNEVPGTTGVKRRAASVSKTTRDASACKVLIVEAKLKSIPDLEQLTRYDDHLADAGMVLSFPEDALGPEWKLKIGKGSATPIKRILLSVGGASMTTPSIREKSIDSTPRPSGFWQGVTWEALCTAMNGAIDDLATSSVKETLIDYTRALGALVTLLGRVHAMCDDAHSPTGAVPTYGAMRSQTLDQTFRSLRISDLLGKTLFEYWLTTYVLTSITVKAPPGWTLNSYVNYSNGVPGLGVELVNENFVTPTNDIICLRLGVQVQSCEFRLFIDVNKGWNGLERWIATHQHLMTEWFGRRLFDEPPVGVKRKNRAAGRTTDLKVFNADRFLYSKVNIDGKEITSVERELAQVLAYASEQVIRWTTNP